MSEEDRTKLRMNLVAIQKVDPYAKEILDSSSHVAFYKFKTNWEKSDIEGSFFIYSRIAAPFYSIFINNRLNTNSLVEPITKQIELQSQPPFLLYRNDRSKINGFWFYNTEDCDRIHSLVDELIKKGSTKPAEGPQVMNQSVVNNLQNIIQTNGRDVDLFSMLSKAQQDYNTGSGSGVPNVNNGASNGQMSNNFLTKQQHEQSMNQKFAAMQVHNNIRHQHQQQQQQQMMMNHQIQQQQQQQQQTTPVKQINANAMPDITSQNVVNFFASATPNSKPSFLSKQNSGIVHQPVTLDEIEKQHRVSASPPNNNMNISEPKMIKPQNLNQLINSAAHNVNTMPIHPNQPKPLCFTGNTPGSFVLPHQVPTIDQQPIIQTLIKPALITPSMFQSSLNTDDKVINQQQQNRPEPLTQDQLLQALNYLIENEPDFLTKLHEAYIKSFNKKMAL
ncbi:unnamed protein product [Diamesa tonsa]